LTYKEFLVQVAKVATDEIQAAQTDSVRPWPSTHTPCRPRGPPWVTLVWYAETFN
jgi:hypothetical protein